MPLLEKIFIGAAAGRHTTNTKPLTNMAAEKPRERKVWSKSELAEAYGITVTTLNTWIKPVVDKHPEFFPNFTTAHLITPKQYELIAVHVGEPN